MREQIEQLEYHAGLRPDRRQLALAAARARPLAGTVADLQPIDLDAAFVVELEQVDAAQKRGLTTARGADDRDHLAAVDVEVHPLEDPMVAERLADATDANEAGSDSGHAAM